MVTEHELGSVREFRKFFQSLLQFSYMTIFRGIYYPHSLAHPGIIPEFAECIWEKFLYCKDFREYYPPLSLAKRGFRKKPITVPLGPLFPLPPPKPCLAEQACARGLGHYIGKCPDTFGRFANGIGDFFPTLDILLYFVC